MNINLDGSFGFGIDLENLMKLQLKVNQELNEEEIKEIIKKAEFQKSLDKTINFCLVRPRSVKEVTDFFKRKEIDRTLQEEIVKRLEKLELIDDIKFAKWWIEQRLEFRSKSKKDIVQELRTKGVKQEIINQVLQNTEIDEVKIAKELMKKKMYKWKNLEPRLTRQKITQYLAGKGFTWDVINKILTKSTKVYS